MSAACTNHPLRTNKHIPSCCTEEQKLVTVYTDKGMSTHLIRAARLCLFHPSCKNVICTVSQTRLCTQLQKNVSGLWTLETVASCGVYTFWFCNYVHEQTLIFGSTASSHNCTSQTQSHLCSVFLPPAVQAHSKFPPTRLEHNRVT